MDTPADTPANAPRSSDRYCEISEDVEVSAGDMIEEGQVIAYFGRSRLRRC